MNDDRQQVPDLFEIDDARMVRIISQPVRYEVLEELFQLQEPRTATELARSVGISPSLMSYHLRELEKVGIVRRRSSARDGREALWVPSARHYRVTVSAEPRPRVRMRLMDAMLAPLRRRIGLMLQRRTERRRQGDFTDDEFTLLSMGTLILTHEEAFRVRDEIREVWSRYERLSEGRRPEDYPVNAVYLWSCLPDDRSQASDQTADQEEGRPH